MLYKAERIYTCRVKNLAMEDVVRSNQVPLVAAMRKYCIGIETGIFIRHCYLAMPWYS